MNLKTETGRPYFYQWDTGQILIVEDEPNCREVHFGYRDGSGAKVCSIREADGRRVVDIPNELLQEDRIFYAYPLNEEDDDSQMRAQSFVVLLRPKPDDYVYTEDEVQTYEALEERITALEENDSTGGNTIKTVNGVSPDENGNVELELPVGDKEWKLIADTIIAKEDAIVTLFLDKDSEGNPFSCEEVTIMWQGIAVTDGTASGRAWISINGAKAGYNCGKMGFVTNSYFYYTSVANYSRACHLMCMPNFYRTTESFNEVNTETDIHALEISGYQQKAFCGRVIVYGR